MMPQPFDPEDILSQPLMANVATLAKDGAPCNAPMWFLWESDAIWLLSGTSARSLQRIENDPRCSVEIVDFQNAAGVLLHLGLRGKASIEPMSAPMFRRLLTKYLGDESNWNAWFIQQVALIDDPDGRFIKLKPESVFTNNVSYFRTGPSLAWPKA